jgi:nucleotide-binding universal stress UspA family protein
MITFTRILCPTDLSPASMPALKYGAAFAAWYDAPLSLLHVVPTFDAIQVPPSTLGDAVQVVYPSTRDEITAALREQAETAGIASVQPDLLAEAGDPVATIVGQALALGADLIVAGTHGRSGISRLLHGSVVEALLHQSPCPVLTVPPPVTAVPLEDVRFSRILCAIDFSPASMQALGFALDLARQADGVVTLLHAVEWLADSEPRTTAHFNVSEYRAHLLEDARQKLEALVTDDLRTGRAIETVAVAGRGYREILRAATERDSDLIVMGAQGRGGLGLAVLGSATHQVVRAATCPVLTVRAAE